MFVKEKEAVVDRTSSHLYCMMSFLISVLMTLRNYHVLYSCTRLLNYDFGHVMVYITLIFNGRFCTCHITEFCNGAGLTLVGLNGFFFNYFGSYVDTKSWSIQARNPQNKSRLGLPQVFWMTARNEIFPSLLSRTYLQTEDVQAFWIAYLSSTSVILKRQAINL